MYHNNPKYWDRQDLANSVHPNNMPQNAFSDQIYSPYPSSNSILDTPTGSQMVLFKF